MIQETRWTRYAAVALGALFALGCETAALHAPDAARPFGDAGDAGVNETPSGDAGCVPGAGFADMDGDGYGDPDAPRRWCGARPDGVADNGDDCDDTSASCRPLADERCDALDNDCDGDIDEDVVDATFFADADGDGFGDPSVTVEDCAPPEGFTDVADDCDDAVADIFPGAAETCDVVDQDCDGAVDEGVLTLSSRPTMLGAYDQVGRNLAIASDGAGAAAVWVEPGGALTLQLLDPAGGLLGGTTRVGDAPASGDAIPRVAITRTEGARVAYVMWAGVDGVRARAVPLDGSAAPPSQLVDADPAARPTDLVLLGGVPYATWQRRQRHYLRQLSPSDLAPVGGEALFVETRATDITESGATAIALDADHMLFGVLDQDVVSGVRSAYVHRVRVRPNVELRVRPGRFALPMDVAPRSVHLAVDPAGDPTQRSALAFVGWGERPDRVTQVFRFIPNAPSASGSIRAVGVPLEGLVIGASLSEAGADWCAVEEEPAGRETLRLRHQPLADLASSAVGTTGPLMPGLWGASAARFGATGFVLFGGRLSPTDVEPQVWANTYGCLP